MSAFDAFMRLEGTLEGSIRTDVSMARHTTYHIGGPAALFVECASLSDLALTLDVLSEEGVAWEVVGRGSNLLVSDDGYCGAVIVLTGQFARCDFGGLDRRDADAPDLEHGQVMTVTCGAGYALSRLVQRAFGCGLSGLEFAVGVPGSVGGAVFMNAGSREVWLGSTVDSVTSYVPGHGLKIRHGDEVSWEYRSSALPSDEVIVECTLRCTSASKEQMQADMEESLARRRAHQPLGQPSCGSVFKNPQGRFAADLIESCELKGTRCGGAQISQKHANFIVNTGSARAMDVLSLIHLARARVEETHGIRLRPEVRFLGFAQ